MRPKSVRTNAIWSSVSLATWAVASVATVSIITRSLSVEEFSAYAIVNQIVLWFFVFKPGLSQAVSKLASRDSNKTESDLAGVVQRSVRVLAFVAVAWYPVVVGLGMMLNELFTSIPEYVVPAARFSLLLGGAAALFTFVSDPFFGLLAGRMLGFANSILTSSTKIFYLLLLLGLFCIDQVGLETIAISSGIASLATTLVLLVIGRRELGPVDIKLDRLPKPVWQDAKAMALMGIATFVIVNVDVLLVGVIDFQKAGAYSIAITITALFAHLVHGASSAAAPIFAQQSRASAGALVAEVSRRISPIIVGVAASIVLIATPVFSVLVGEHYARTMQGPLVVLTATVVIRHLTNILLLAAYGLDQRRTASIPLAVEGLVNIAASLLLGLKFGVMGIAFGSLIGATSGMFVTGIYLVRADLGDMLQGLFRGSVRSLLWCPPVAGTVALVWSWDRPAADLETLFLVVVLLAVNAVSGLDLVRALGNDAWTKNGGPYRKVILKIIQRNFRSK